jgi:hypothetical protein
MAITKITYQGKEIIYGDYRLLSPAEIVAGVKEVAAIAQSSKNGVLVLTNIESVPINFQIFEEIKALGNDVFRKKVNRSAVLGITGVKRFLLKTYVKFTKDNAVPFSSMEEALTYLVQDE